MRCPLGITYGINILINREGEKQRYLKDSNFSSLRGSKYGNLEEEDPHIDAGVMNFERKLAIYWHLQRG